ncbi:MAG: transglycosylase SLT domain-containing protein [Bacteroidaceae bacterium]|nr:transglycosylase SLT domain-containing protein [Bacteroidaceae bacterium]MBR3982624.1 transglycosylase SLT domain-containing protein [Bacteroidaceae bacterium]
MKKYLIALSLLLLGAAAKAQQVITVYDENTGKEETIGLPEGMQDEELDSMMRQWCARTYLTYDSAACESTGEDIAYEPEVYVRRLQNLPNVIEMPYNPVVRKFIDQYTGRLRRSVAMFLGASNFYMPIFEDALEAYQLPLELKYLPIIESALNPGATSKAGAGGLWQFMPTTGKRYGLEITSLIDDRRDPVKASYAAARMLRSLYEIFGDWTLVIASYNCGPGNVSKAIKRAGGEKDYWKIYPYLPSETRGYVPAFIAANYVMNYYCEHNICPASTRLPMGTDTIVVSRDVYMEQISDVCGISMEELKALNPQYRTTKIPGNASPCNLRMPMEAIHKFIESGDTVYTHRLSELNKRRSVVEVNEKVASQSSKGTKYVKVRRGDTLGGIASKNRTTVAKIKRLNGLKGTNIRVGQRLRVR